MTSLWDQYRAYIAWLNGRSWNELGAYAASDVQHNGRNLGLTGCRDMLINDFDQIPDLFFKIGLLTCEPPFVAARLGIRLPPKGAFLGLPVDGRRISFAENVFHQFRDRRIASVWPSIRLRLRLS